MPRPLPLLLLSSALHASAFPSYATPVSRCASRSIGGLRPGRNPALAARSGRLPVSHFSTLRQSEGRSRLSMRSTLSPDTKVTGGGSFGTPPTLSYFDARGAAEIIRYLFAAAGVEYIDNRYPFQMEGMFGQPGFKVTKKEFDDDKANGKFPFGKVPVFETEGVTVAQSKAIERYVARKVGMFGATELEGLQIDMVCEQLRDIKDAWTRAKGQKGSDGKSVDTFFDEELPKQMGFLEKLIKPSGFFNGDTLSLADISFYHFVTSTFTQPPYDDKMPKILDAYPKLRALKDMVANTPKIQAWEESRPKSNF